MPLRFWYAYSSWTLVNSSLVPPWTLPAGLSTTATPPGCHSSTHVASYIWASQQDCQLRTRNSYPFPSTTSQPFFSACFSNASLVNRFSRVSPDCWASETCCSVDDLSNPNSISNAWFTRVAEKDFEYAIDTLLNYFWSDSILAVVYTLHSVSMTRTFIRKDESAAVIP